MPKTKYRYMIGIDPGVNTGIAIWDAQQGNLLAVFSATITKAMEYIQETVSEHPYECYVIVEDARLRNIYRSNDYQQGVGSVKRDCSIWEGYLKENDIPYLMRKPVNTKVPAAAFASLTKWTIQTNNHARDAAMIVYGHSGFVIK